MDHGLNKADSKLHGDACMFISETAPLRFLRRISLINEFVKYMCSISKFKPQLWPILAPEIHNGSRDNDLKNLNLYQFILDKFYVTCSFSNTVVIFSFDCCFTPHLRIFHSLPVDHLL